MTLKSIRKGILRVFALSDIHVDYDDNLAWVNGLSRFDYQEDILILAGDVSDRPELLIRTFDILRRVFKETLYLPGNHELWVSRDRINDSFVKFETVLQIAEDCGVRTAPFHWETLSIVPLYGWYDASFGTPSLELKHSWSDFTACKWPQGYGDIQITQYFTAMNESALETQNDTVISFSHFLPRIDLMPPYIPKDKRWVYPVLGTSKIEQQIRRLQPNIHIYGHSHVNQRRQIDNIVYINNAFGYPHEISIASKKLRCIFETS